MAPPNAAAVMARAITLKYIFVNGLSIPPPESIAGNKNRWSSDVWNGLLEEMRKQNTALVDRLRGNALWNGMDQQERNFMEAGVVEITERERADRSWRMGSMICLPWALGFISNPHAHDQRADPKLSNTLPADPVETLLANAGLRPHDSIERQGGLAELWHGRSPTRSLQESGHKPALSGDMAFERINRSASARAAANGNVAAAIDDDFPAFGRFFRNLSSEEYSRATSLAPEPHQTLNWPCGFAPGNRWDERPTDT